MQQRGLNNGKLQAGEVPIVYARTSNPENIATEITSKPHQNTETPVIQAKFATNFNPEPSLPLAINQDTGNELQNSQVSSRGIDQNLLEVDTSKSPENRSNVNSNLVNIPEQVIPLVYSKSVSSSIENDSKNNSKMDLGFNATNFLPIVTAKPADAIKSDIRKEDNSTSLPLVKSTKSNSNLELIKNYSQNISQPSNPQHKKNALPIVQVSQVENQLITSLRPDLNNHLKNNINNNIINSSSGNSITNTTNSKLVFHTNNHHQIQNSLSQNNFSNRESTGIKQNQSNVISNSPNRSQKQSKPSDLNSKVSHDKPRIDVDALADKVERKLISRLAVEKERRGKK